MSFPLGVIPAMAPSALSICELLPPSPGIRAGALIDHERGRSPWVQTAQAGPPSLAGLTLIENDQLVRAPDLRAPRERLTPASRAPGEAPMD